MADDSVAGVGRIAARIDRLPLTWVQWRLALVTQIFWGVIIAADGIPAKLYPFVWGPKHSFGSVAFSVLLAMQFGVGILVGEYLIGIVADRWGRRMALLLSSLAVALPLWPTALTDHFGLLLLFFGLSSIGMGGVLSTNVVYMGEIVPPAERGRVMLASQVLAVLVFGLLGNVPGILWVPAHYQWFIYLFTAVPIVVLVPLALWMPESPRWLEAHGRHEEAERVMAAMEAECLRRSGVSQLPEPDFARYAVPVTRHVPVRELFSGEYGERTVLLLVAWIIGYAGLVYGFTGFLPVLLRSFGLSAGTTFGALLVAAVAGGCIGLTICALIGEAVERRTSIVASAILFTIAMGVLYFDHTVLAAYVLSAVAWGTMTVWLFNMYNYTAAAYPTRLRATGVGLTDGLGHLGSIFGPLVAGWLFTSTAYLGHPGWYLYVTIPGALLPAALIGWWGINQRGAILEQIST
ncbi:MFS transporter [Rhodopila sp.]|jgi:putative MFS transporter|uniref:MFS transporter n=1 Tax=Rhodopila sp. TaxID=2480087 RepID=UPI002CC963F7|nr:MFS transporter [Rhodopila sp.]HVZ07628.1 MFS transporter [Rhodopila sp.]